MRISVSAVLNLILNRSCAFAGMWVIVFHEACVNARKDYFLPQISRTTHPKSVNLNFCFPPDKDGWQRQNLSQKDSVIKNFIKTNFLFSFFFLPFLLLLFPSKGKKIIENPYLLSLIFFDIFNIFFAFFSPLIFYKESPFFISVRPSIFLSRAVEFSIFHKGAERRH